MAYDKTNTGVLFKNDKGDNPKRPDRTGTIDIEGVEYRLSGWIKDRPNDAPFLSLKAERKEQPPVAAQMNAQARQAQQLSRPKLEDEDIEF